MSLKRRIRRVAHRFGYDVVALSTDLAGQQRVLLRDQAIDLMVDVGANEGQYVQKLRALGYTGAVISFEPGAEAFNRLAAASAGDDGWSVRRLALGDGNHTTELRVSRNSVSSSLLDMEDAHLEAAPRSAVISTEPVSMRTLDGELSGMSDLRIWLKIDTQGAEHLVLAGAQAALPHVRVVQCELSLRPLYRQGAVWTAVVQTLADAGLRLVGLEPGIYDRAGRELLQFDGLFLRDEPRGRA